MYREKLATVMAVIVTIGSVMAFQSPMTTNTFVDWLPSELDIGDVRANTWRRNRPRENNGIEERMNAALVATLSPMLLRLTAWKIPSGKATSTAITSDIPDR